MTTLPGMQRPRAFDRIGNAWLEFSEMRVLDIWYAHIDMEDLIPTVKDNETRARIRKRLTESARRERG